MDTEFEIDTVKLKDELKDIEFDFEMDNEGVGELDCVSDGVIVLDIVREFEREGGIVLLPLLLFRREFVIEDVPLWDTVLEGVIVFVWDVLVVGLVVTGLVGDGVTVFDGVGSDVTVLDKDFDTVGVAVFVVDIVGVADANIFSDGRLIDDIPDVNIPSSPSSPLLPLSPTAPPEISILLKADVVEPINPPPPPPPPPWALFASVPSPPCASIITDDQNDPSSESLARIILPPAPPENI